MELSEIYQKRGDKGVRNRLPKISFEVFPPKNGDISELFEQVRRLKKYKPELISLTYGANGGTRDLSLELLRVFLDLELNVMPHFTCVGITKELVEHYITQIENMGIENILSLRGDIPKDKEISLYDFKYANELVDFIHQKTTLSIGVAGYPEGHIECENIQKDIENLKKKVDAGASAIFTQLFFENDKFYRYVDMVRKAGINLPIVAGIMPVRSLKHLNKMIEMTRVSVPKNLVENFEKYPEASKKIGVEFAINQSQNLIDEGVVGLHYFTLNHSDQMCEILDNIL